MSRRRQCLLLMARKGRGRKRSFILKGEVDETLALGTLASAVVIGDGFNDTVDDSAWAISAELTWTIRDRTVNQAPIIVGLAHGDYTDAEIEEFLENTGSWTRGDLIAQEIGRRRIRVVGSFEGLTPDEVLNDGKTIKTKLGFLLLPGQTVKLWAWNKSGATLTTGAAIGVFGHVWLRPTG